MASASASASATSPLPGVSVSSSLPSPTPTPGTDLRSDSSPRRSPPTAAASPPPEQPTSTEKEPKQEEATPLPRKTRLPRACNSRPKAPPAPPPELPRRRGRGGGGDETPQCRVVTPLVAEPDAPAELPRWRLRGMWELASVLNFLHVFRPLLNIAAEFTAEELEEALVMPNFTLDDVHMPLLRSIPPITRMAMGRGSWVTVLCRKLKDWWHWVAEGDLPIVASHGAEIEMYKELEPATRLVILKAICDIRGEQEDVRNFIDSSLKHGYQLSSFRKERIGGDSYGISYWYEDDPVLGYRMYREIRRVEYVKKLSKKSKGRRVSTPPVVSYQWETVASNFDEFEAAAEKLFSSRNRTEVSLGKKLKIDYLPEIEKIHKKERLLKKQQREALLDSYLTVDGLTFGRSLRDRKPVTYTFDDYDRSINEAIKTTKKGENSAELVTTTNRRMLGPRQEASSNGKLNGPSPVANEFYNGESPPKSYDYQESNGEQEVETLEHSNRRRKRSQRYTQDFVEVVSDIDLNFDSDDDIMGEAVYDEEYLRSRKLRKASPSEEDEEFRLEEVDTDDDDDEDDYSLSTSEDMEELQQHKKLPTHSRPGTKLRYVDEIQAGLRRSKRSTRPHINYRQYDLSDTDIESGKPGKSNASDPDAGSDALNDMELSTSSQDQEEEEDEGPEELKESNKSDEEYMVDVNNEHQQQCLDKTNVSGREGRSAGRKFLDLNELVPGSGFDDGPSLMVKDTFRC